MIYSYALCDHRCGILRVSKRTRSKWRGETSLVLERRLPWNADRVSLAQLKAGSFYRWICCQLKAMEGLGRRVKYSSSEGLANHGSLAPTEENVIRKSDDARRDLILSPRMKSLQRPERRRAGGDLFVSLIGTMINWRDSGNFRSGSRMSEMEL